MDGHWRQKLSIFAVLTMAGAACGESTFRSVAARKTGQSSGNDAKLGQQPPGSETILGSDLGPFNTSSGPSGPESTPSNPLDGLSIIDSSIVSKVCAAGTPMNLTQVINFPATTRGACGWGQNDNLTRSGGRVRARVEQMAELSLPAGSVLCSLQLQVQENTMTYDDHFYLNLNGNVLLASFVGITQNLLEQDGLKAYDWMRARDYRWPDSRSNQTPAYCLGRQTTDTANCFVPETERAGQMRLTLGAAEAAKLSAIAFNQQKAVFSMVTVGDDDTRDDCFHTAININVTAAFVKGK